MGFAKLIYIYQNTIPVSRTKPALLFFLLGIVYSIAFTYYKGYMQLNLKILFLVPISLLDNDFFFTKKRVIFAPFDRTHVTRVFKEGSKRVHELNLLIESSIKLRPVLCTLGSSGHSKVTL